MPAGSCCGSVSVPGLEVGQQRLAVGVDVDGGAGDRVQDRHGRGVGRRGGGGGQQQGPRGDGQGDRADDGAGVDGRSHATSRWDGLPGLRPGGRSGCSDPGSSFRRVGSGRARGDRARAARTPSPDQGRGSRRDRPSSPRSRASPRADAGLGEPPDLARDRGQPAALLVDVRPVDGVAVAGHRPGPGGHQPDDAVDRDRPLLQERVGTQRGRGGRLDQVPDHDQVGVGHHDDQVAAGVPAPEVDRPRRGAHPGRTRQPARSSDSVRARPRARP